MTKKKGRPSLTDIVEDRSTAEDVGNTSRGPGRPREADSLRAQVRRGEAKHLRAIIPTELFEKLEREAFENKTTISELVAKALEEYV